MTNQDNAIAVVRRMIRHYKIPVTDQSVEEVLKSHSDYPSLKSICDALNEWKIENYPMRLDRDELRDAGSPFIAHLKDKEEKIAFVPGFNGNSKVTYYDSFGKSKTVGKETFFNMYSGVSILIDPGEDSGDRDFTEKAQADMLNRILPFLVGLALILYSVYAILTAEENRLNITFRYFALLLTKLIGLGLSVLLVLKDLNINSRLADTLCGFASKTNCNSLLNTDAVKVYGWLHWSDVGVIYFLTGLLMMIGFPETADYNLMSIISFGALGYVVYSIYYQAVVAKTWCPLCLGVQAVLLSEAAIQAPYLLRPEITWNSVVHYGSIFITVAFGVILYKGYFTNKQLSQQERIAYLKFKKNPTVFTNLLYNSTRKIFNFPQNYFVIGKSDAPVIVTAFLSMTCNPCQKAFNQLKTLVSNENVQVNLIFSLHDKVGPLIMQMVLHLNENKSTEAIGLLDTWYNANGNERELMIRQASKSYSSNSSFKAIQKKHSDLFVAAEIAGTPTIFVNGHILPREYQIDDIAYFIDILIK